ncbi:S-layer homology domain-containing protein [Metabacillus iocasae]|uniref:SLH domain-containing protein n=1 Tax=Priestia iocasae TaxID=2291674 RepID=A0ABS2QVC9_9BACI|nr:S-layer homology domain-containing protein [Metabacillus iocasae]MBM7703449.1 hypothetical protein [Metabacillus iocasae]
MFKNKLKKLVATTAAALVVASSALPFSASAQSVFSDVPTNHPHYEAIEFLTDVEIITGYEDGTFKPNNHITRGQTAKMISRFYYVDEEPSMQVFKDLPVTYSDKELVVAANLMHEMSVMTGANGYFMPFKNITRQQMAKVLVEEFGLDYVEGAQTNIKDLDKAFPEFQDYIEILAQNEVTVVSEFKPTEPVSRAQFASFVYRALLAQDFEN